MVVKGIMLVQGTGKPLNGLLAPISTCTATQPLAAGIPPVKVFPLTPFISIEIILQEEKLASQVK